MELSDQEIGMRIKNIRKEKGLTLKQFGKMIDAPFSAVSNWENGRNKPNSERLKKIAEIGDITVEELLYGDFLNFFHSVINDYLKSELKNEDVGELVSDKERLNNVINRTLEQLDDYSISSRNKYMIRMILGFELDDELERGTRTNLNAINYISESLSKAITDNTNYFYLINDGKSKFFAPSLSEKLYKELHQILTNSKEQVDALTERYDNSNKK